jgi:outer membrane protein assembly factor BamB
VYGGNEMRIGNVYLIFLLVILLFICGVQADSMFRADPIHDGIYDDGGIHPNNIKLWSFTTGDNVFSSPAVENGIVYVGSEDHNLYARNALTGNVVWTFPTAFKIDSSPAIANGTVYFANDGDGFYAVSVTDGHQIWTFPSASSDFTSPTVANGNVYVAQKYGKVFALNGINGNPLWENYLGQRIKSSFAVTSNLVYIGTEGVGTSGGSLFALKTSTGEQVWQYSNTGGAVGSSPAVGNGMVYFGSEDHKFYALNSTTGALVWTYTTGGVVASSPAIANGIVYFTSYDGNLYALNALTGAQIWTYSLTSGTTSSPAFANGVVYVGSGCYKLFAINAATGTQIWTYTTGSTIHSSPAVANGIVYVGSADKNLYAIGNLTVTPTVTTTTTTPDLPFQVPCNCTNENISIKSAPSSTRWTRVPFDGWRPAMPATHPMPDSWAGITIPGTWVWANKTAAGTSNDGRFIFQRVFNINTLCCWQNVTANLTVAADDEFNLTVNNRPVNSPSNWHSIPEGPPCGQQNSPSVYTYDVLPYLHNGLNVINITAQNHGVPCDPTPDNAGILFNLNISYADCCPPDYAGDCGNSPITNSLNVVDGTSEVETSSSWFTFWPFWK